MMREILCILTACLLSCCATGTELTAMITNQVRTSGIDLSGCGVSKGCYRDPSHCQGDACQSILTWRDNGETVHFEVQGQIHPDTEGVRPYLTVGYSYNTKMSNTSVVDCISNSSQGVIIQMSTNQHGHPPNFVLEPDSQIGLVEGSLRGSFIDGRLMCEFSRTKVVDKSLPSSQYVFDLNQTLYAMLVYGPTDEFGVKQYHERVPLTTPNKVNFSENVNIGGAIGHPMIKAHGCLMIIAWVLLASAGIVVARYLKPIGNGYKILGKDVWFQVHQCLMGLAFCLTLSGFIIIFVKERHLYIGKAVHPILGIIVMSLTLINPIMAFLRPGPASDKRPYFKWAHFLVGNLAYILAGTALFTGVQMEESLMPSWSHWLVLTFILFTVVTHFLLSGERLLLALRYAKADGSSPYVQFDICESKNGDDRQDLIEEQSKAVSTLTSTILAIYIAQAFGLTVALVVELITA